MAITMLEYQLMQEFKDSNVTMNMAFEIISVLHREDQQKQMLDYLRKNLYSINDKRAGKQAVRILLGKKK